MAVVDPTTNYLWEIPDVGGDIGSWGGLLNTVMANELTAEELVTHATTPISPPPGIDQIIHLLQLELDDAEADIAEIATRVTTLETAPPALLTAKLSLASAHSVQAGTGVPIAWTTVDHDVGSLTVPNTQKITVPVDGLGLWQLHAYVEMPYHSGGSGNDDGRYIQLALVKNGSIIGMGLVADTVNGSHSSDSGTTSCEASVIDVAADGDVYEVFVVTGAKNGSISATTGSYFEAIRITKEVP